MGKNSVQSNLNHQQNWQNNFKLTQLLVELKENHLIMDENNFKQDYFKALEGFCKIIGVMERQFEKHSPNMELMIKFIYD